MNKAILTGRLTKDPEVRYSTSDSSMAIAKYALAVPRRFSKEGEQSCDFINCTAFGKSGEFAEKYFRKGTKVAISGRIQTGSYVNKDGIKVYTTDVIVEEQEFAESKNVASGAGAPSPNPGNFSTPSTSGNTPPAGDGFMDIPDGIDEELPFN